MANKIIEEHRPHYLKDFCSFFLRLCDYGSMMDVKIFKEVIVAYSEVLSMYLSGVTEKTTESSVELSSVPSEIRTKDFPNASPGS